MRGWIEESTLRLSVRDTGIGISKENEAKIFERFHQVSEAHKEVGTGIGLSLVKELIAFLNGTIKVISSEGRGSEFVVSIPIQFTFEAIPHVELIHSVEDTVAIVADKVQMTVHVRC